MKYFYNGRLLRTSNNEYHYALLVDGVLMCCSKTENGCKSKMKTERNFTERLIKGYEKNHNEADKEKCLKFLNAKWEIVELEAR